MATQYFFGELPGEPVGTEYTNRAAAAAAGVHQVRMQGIAGNRNVGCASIVMSGGYDTDEDHGHEIFYTGRGGQNPANPRGPHISDQDLALNDNAALVTSESTGKPLRIVRGAGHKSPYAPTNGYRYDGLYRVAAHYPIKHPRDGFVRWMFHLVQLTAEEAAPYTPEENRSTNAKSFMLRDLGSGAPGAGDKGPDVDPFFGGPALLVMPTGAASPGTKTVVTQRVVRDTKVTVAVKAIYDNSCQVCGTRVLAAGGTFSEGAHIRPLGRPHHGPDVMSNILCLCPNHHAAFDKGGLFVGDDFSVWDRNGALLGELTIDALHEIDPNHFRYHRSHHRLDGVAMSAGVRVPARASNHSGEWHEGV